MSVGHEYTRLGEAMGALLNAPQAALAVGMSCAIGLGISFTGFGFRNLVTATTFTVVGVMNKLLTVVASLMLLSHGATSPWSVLALICCIGGAETIMQPPSKGTIGRAPCHFSPLQDSRPVVDSRFHHASLRWDHVQAGTIACASGKAARDSRVVG